MLIQCTKKLLDQIGITKAEALEEDDIFSWHANIITINRRKAVVLMNNQSRYTIVLFGLKAKDFKQLDQVILEAIRQVFKDENISDEVIEDYIAASPGLSYGKTKNRSMVARLNKACEMAYFYQDLLRGDRLIQSAVSRRASTYLVGPSYVYPNQEMYKDLGALTRKPVFDLEAVSLNVVLDLEGYQVWRTLVVPLNTSFRQLHNILQVAFGWRDYHLHEFFIYGPELAKDNELSLNHPGYHKDGYKAVMNLYPYEEDFEDPAGVPMISEIGIKLSDWMPAKLKYNYDFGDNWQHYIEADHKVIHYDRNYATCTAGAGNAPPEDVGGEYGYSEFLKFMADTDHPDHEEMAQWGRSQGYAEFDLEEINRRLENALIE